MRFESSDKMEKSSPLTAQEEGSRKTIQAEGACAKAL